MPIISLQVKPEAFSWLNFKEMARPGLQPRQPLQNTSIVKEVGVFNAKNTTV
jgi:hypothetical protein